LTPKEEIKKLTIEILELEEEFEVLKHIDTYHNVIDPKVKAFIDMHIKRKVIKIKLIKLFNLK
jgi:hypothetical protein